MIKYENLITGDADLGTLLKRLEKILEFGWTAHRHSPILDLGSPIDWSYNDEQERSWNYHKHCWAMLDTILAAHSKAAENVDLQLAVNIALDWVEKNVTPDGEQNEEVSKFAWYDMAVGLRVQRLAYLLDAARRENLLTEKQDKLLWQALKVHQAYLEDDKNIAFHTNHGYYQAAGQIAMGRRFKDIDPTMNSSMKKGLERFRSILKSQFTSEGVHKEHSPSYHVMVYQTLKGMLEAGLIKDNEILSFTKKIEVGLSNFILPNKTLVDFGDSEPRSLSLDSTRAREVWQTNEMQYVVTNGEIGEPPNNELTVFEESGYFVIRKNLNKKDNEYKNFSYLAQIAAFHSRTHKHADDLSFVWYDRGRSILIDAGRYGYVGKAEIGTELWKQGYWYTHPHRIYCESTRAHNTLEFDGKNYPRKGVKPYGSAIGRSKVYDNGLTVLETETKHFKTIRRVRVIIYLPNQWLVIFDWFKDNLEHKHNVRQWFNFAPDLKIEKHNNSYCTQIDQNTNLYITNLLPNVKGSKIIRGVKEPRLQGWYSPAQKVFEPTSSLNYELNDSSTESIVTLFTFNKLDKVEHNDNVVSLSGRRFRLSWVDKSGKHIIQMNRDEGKSISVDYKYSLNSGLAQNKDDKDVITISGFVFEPYKDIEVEEPVRLVIYDYIIEDFIHFKVIESYEMYLIPYESITNPANSKFKYQLKDKMSNRWVDIGRGYTDVEEVLRITTAND